MKKKMYESPRTDVVFIYNAMPLLAGSVMIPGGDNDPPGAHEFFDDEWEITPDEFSDDETFM